MKDVWKKHVFCLWTSEMPKSAKRRGSSILALESLSCPAYFGTTDGFKTLQKSIQTSCQVSISYQPVELYMTYQHRCEVYIPEPHVGPSEFPYPDLLNAKVPPRYRSAQSGLPYHSLRRLGRQGGGHWTQQVACDNFLGRICLEHLSPGKNVSSVWSTNMAVVCKQQSASIGHHCNRLFHQKINIKQPRDIPQQLPNNKACHQKDRCFPQSHTVKSWSTKYLTAEYWSNRQKTQNLKFESEFHCHIGHKMKCFQFKMLTLTYLIPQPWNIGKGPANLQTAFGANQELPMASLGQSLESLRSTQNDHKTMMFIVYWCLLNSSIVHWLKRFEKQVTKKSRMYIARTRKGMKKSSLPKGFYDACTSASPAKMLPVDSPSHPLPMSFQQAPATLGKYGGTVVWWLEYQAFLNFKQSISMKSRWRLTRSQPTFWFPTGNTCQSEDGKTALT